MNHQERLKELAAYFEGHADALASMQRFDTAAHFKDAAKYLRQFQSEVCGQGYVCRGGPKCGSDHK